MVACGMGDLNANVTRRLVEPCYEPLELLADAGVMAGVGTVKEAPSSELPTKGDLNVLCGLRWEVCGWAG